MLLGRLPALAIALLSVGSGVAPWAQLQAVPVQRVGEARITMRTGEIVRGDAGEKSAGLGNAFTNVDWSGFYTAGSTTSSTTGRPLEDMDWGKVTTPTGSDIVGEFTFGYGTSVSDASVGGPGASVVLRFYDGVTGWCADSGAVPTATFSFTGLPGDALGAASAWVVTVDLSGGFEFESSGVGNPFGYGFTTIDDVAGDGTRDTGPLLCYAGELADPINIPDSNGQVNVFDVWDDTPQSNVCLGTFFFSSLPKHFSSWYLTLETAVADAGNRASATFRNGGSNPGTYVVTSPPVLGDRFVATDQSASGGLGVFVLGYRTPLDLPTRYGQLLVNPADPAGDQLAGSNGPYLFVGGATQIAIDVPPRLDLCGLAIATQTLEFGAGLRLHNAQDLVLGF